MLERVPATAESAAQFFLRNLERPCRSTRVLDPHFWRNATEIVPSASWWPLYLQKVRQVPHPARESRHNQTTRWSHQKSSVAKDSLHGRQYTVSASRQAQASPQQAYDVFEFSEEIRSENENGAQPVLTEDHDSSTRNFKPIVGAVEVSSLPIHTPPERIRKVKGRKKKVQQEMEQKTEQKVQQKTMQKRGGKETSSTVLSWLSTSQRKEIDFQVFLQSKDSPFARDFDEAWLLFISLDNQEDFAADVFDFLSRSEDPKHFSKTRESFRLIPRHIRTRKMYQAVINLELKRFQHRDAMNLAFEASIIGFDLLPGLLAYFVQNVLWNSAAELIYRNRTARRDLEMFVPPSERRPGSQMLNMAQLTRQCRTVKDLPMKILSLAGRLKEQNIALFEHRELLLSLHRDLLRICVQSPEAMATVTASALLALFDLQKEFGNLNLHARALSTFQKLPNRKEKVELALLTYRNFRFAFPHQSVERWMLGGLIATCGEANYPLHIYDYLLEQFETHFGQPDALAYQRIMTLCARQGNTRSVENVFQQYLRHESRPTKLEFLSPLIYACAVGGDTANARKHFDRIKEQFGLEQNINCWNMLMLAHARSVDDISAFDIFEEMQRQNVHPNSYSYGILLAVCEAHADIETALSLLADAEQHQIHISVPMINTIIEIYLSEDNVTAARRFALAATRSGTSESLTRTWNIFLRHAAVRGDLGELMKTRSIMAGHKIKSDDMSYAALVLALTTLKRTQEAVQVLRKMHHEQGIAVTSLHYSTILHGFLVEGNRDMATVIYNEMKRRLPRPDHRANQAMLLLQARRDRSSELGNARSGDYLATILSDLYASDNTDQQYDTSVGSPKTTATIASLYFDTMLQSLIRNKSYDDADRLLRGIENKMDFKSYDSSQTLARSLRFLLAKMDVAIARSDASTVEKVWKQLFERAFEERRSIETIRRERNSGIDGKIERHEDNEKTSSSRRISTSSASSTPSTVLRGWRTSLSRPLNRYMEAMAREGRQTEVSDFLKLEFEPAGFRLTATNWNKYVQILCRSPRTDLHVRAFKVTERRLIGRAQSWKLLARGLLRQRKAGYVFEKVTESSSRPVLQKQSTFSVTARSDLMRLNPQRNIPTYTTMVHLAAVLSVAERRASSSFPGELESISTLANRTKRFLQNMPWLNDPMQNELLRNQDAREGFRPRPRSEESVRARTDVSGILDSESKVDHIPAEYLSQVEELLENSNELRDRLRGSERVVKRGLGNHETHAVEIAEKLTGQIARSPQILPRLGRLETVAEVTMRIKRQEQEKLQALQGIRKELRDRNTLQTLYRTDLESVAGAPKTESTQENTASQPSLLSTTATQQGKARDPTNQQAAFSPTKTIVNSEPSIGFPVHITRQSSGVETPVTFGQTSVSGQLQELKFRRQELFSRLASRKKSKGKLAIPYAETRRIKRNRASAQRGEARSLLEDLRTSGLISSRALEPRTAAGRRISQLDIAQERVESYLEYEAELKQGKRLSPFPRGMHAYRRHRRKYGPIQIRFVTDKNRHKDRHLIRRGKLIEKRQPRITAKVDQSTFLVHKKRRSKSYRRLLNERLAKRRIHLQNMAARRMGVENYLRLVERRRRTRLAFQPLR